MKRWNGKFNTNADTDAISPDYNGDGIFDEDYAYRCWWHDMRRIDAHLLAQECFTAGYNRRKEEDEEEEK